MSSITSKNTKLEVSFLKKLSSAVYAQGYRYRKHYSKIPGKPDIVFPSKKIAVFLDGCFWHGCKLHSRMPLSNVTYWSNKIERNKKRDKEVNRLLKKAGWKIVRIWEHEVKNAPERAVAKILNILTSRTRL